ncbi:type IV pilin protein [Pseudoxanthomonas sacheonensis]|uniref:Type IV pilus assembly protein PilE n=1 Tax=Pseudoxanthomonas sacheonensis TaxID=443615 RepID=A0ABU1RMS9_9GAMM|nr:type IV pilin protein [Pseudoxanthomonas sacheonensis]MDR6840077.1 type IV pilus assembly protein PilE [Pseudoxanthomonas sacheonensis]
MATKTFYWRSSRYSVVGFSLLELMIVVAIVAILATVANASYREYVLKSRRAAAATCLQERAHFMERYYTTTLTYAGAPNPAQCGPELNDFYTIAFNGTPAAKTFVLTASPTTRQNDPKCGTLSLNAQGARTASGTASSTPADCW